MAVLLRRATVISPTSSFHQQVVDISIDNGVVQRIGREAIAPGEQDEVMDLAGASISAGWVDVFADYREPGFEQKETIVTGLNAAAASGFTDVFLAPNTNPVVDTKSIVQYVLQQSSGHTVALHPLGAITVGIEGKKLAEMLDMHVNGALAVTDGWKPVQHAGMMQKALEYVKAFDGTVIQIPVEESLAKGGLMHEGEISTRLGMPGIPELAETLLVHRDIELARYTESKLHITGVSAAGTLALIRKAKDEGVRVTCSVTPYHLALTDAALQGYSSLYKVLPPLRTEADRQALIAGLADGTIDCIATHHRPQDWDAKTKEYEYAGDGMNVQEMAFPIIWTAVKGKVSLERVVDALAVKPREIFNLPMPELAEGGKASFTLFAPDAPVVVAEAGRVSMSANNPFYGLRLVGKVIGIL